MVIIQNAETGEKLNWTTESSIKKRRNQKSKGARKTSLKNQAKGAVKGWWSGLGPDKQAEIVGSALTIGVPLLIAGGKYVYNKIKNWKSKGKPTNETNEGKQSIKYATGGGGTDPINLDNYGDGTSGGFGGGGEVYYANPIIL